MAIMRTCCCCGVRNGSTASGWYTLVIGLVSLAIFGYAYSFAEVWANWVDNRTMEDEYGNTAVFMNNDFTKEESNIYKVKTFILVFLIFYGCLILSSLILLFGICSDKPYTFIPWMICNSIMAVLHVADGVYLVVLTGGLTAMIIHMVIQFLFAALNVYCVLCVISHFQNLRQGITGLEPQHTMVIIQTNQMGELQAPPAYEQVGLQPKC